MRAFAKLKLSKLNHLGKFIYPHHVNYKTLNLIPCNKQNFINSQKSVPNFLSPKANQTWTLICTTQLTKLARQQHNKGGGNPKALDCCIHEFWVVAPEGIKQSRLHHSHKASPQGKHNLTLLQNQLVSFNNNKQKMPYVSKIYKFRTNLLKHLKLTRINALILAHLETRNKKLKFGKDKDCSKNYQDGLTRDNHPSKQVCNQHTPKNMQLYNHL